MAFNFSLLAPSSISPGSRALAITPSDTVPLANTQKGLLVTGAGNVMYVTTGGDTVSLTGCTVGQVLGVHLIAFVKATGTTATVVGISD